MLPWPPSGRCAGPVKILVNAAAGKSESSHHRCRVAHSLRWLSKRPERRRHGKPDARKGGEGGEGEFTNRIAATAAAATLRARGTTKAEQARGTQTSAEPPHV